MSLTAYLYTITKNTRSTRLPTQAPIRYTIEHVTTERNEPEELTNAAPLPLEECILHVTPGQDLHGYDRPWAGGMGKNLLANNGPDTLVSYGVTFTKNADGSVTANGINTGGGSSLYRIPISMPAGDYLFSSGITIQPALGRVQCLIWDSTESRRARKWDGTTQSDGALDDLLHEVQFVAEHQYFMNCYIISGQTADNITFRPMICASTETDPSFAPYSNVCPITQPANVVSLTMTGPDDVSSSWDLEIGPSPSTFAWGCDFNAITGYYKNPWQYQAAWDYNIFGAVGEPWISSRDPYVPGTQPSDGADVAWMAHTGDKLQIQPWDVRTYAGDNTIELQDGSVELAYVSYGDEDPPEALEIEIDLKEPTDVLHPELLLDLTGNPCAYNYMYLPEFHRYYWLRNWVSESFGCWSVSADVDVLASWRSEIFDLQLYVLRAAAAGDGRVIDHMYPALADVRRQLLDIRNSFWILDNLGTYVISICGEGEMSYYAMSPVEYKQFFTALLGDTYVDDVMSYLPDWETIYPQAKLEINPLQYISGIKWYPLNSLPGVPVSQVSSIPVGYGDVGVVAYKIGNYAVAVPHNIPLYFRSIHPQSARGVYLNYAPYTELHLFVPPFGVVTINPATAQAYGTMQMEVSVDIRSGEGVLRLMTPDGSVETELHAKIGVSVALGQTVNAGYGLLDATGAAAGVVGGVASAVSAFTTGNIAGGVGAVAGTVSTATSAVGNAISAQIPTTRTVGSPESIGALRGPMTLYADHYMVAPEDITHRGRPLCQERRLGDLPGYVLVADADFAMPCMQEEHDAIRALLEGGVFIE